MNISKDLAVYRLLLIILLSFAEGGLGRPHKYVTEGGDSKITKRVEISGIGQQQKSQVASRRQSVIHLGQDYDSDEDGSKPEEDDLENLGKVVDYDGKVIETNKPGASKWKDTAAISKDVIERIKEIQDSLIKRTGGKNLEEKLQLLQPEKNVTVATAESNGVTSRKIIPEDVVNKIIEKFQELKSQAKELAKLDKKQKAEDAEKEPLKVESEGDKKDEKAREDQEARKVNRDGAKLSGKFFSPYESIGPAKENEEVKNITQHSVTESSTTMPGNQEIFKSSSSGPVEDAQTRQQNSMQEQMRKNNAMFQQANMMQQNMMSQNMMSQNMMSQNMMQQPNMPGNTMMMPGKYPMMFIKSGEMLVPVFGGQNGPSYGYPSGYEDRRGVDGQTGGSFVPAQPALIPQQPMIENGQSRSGPPAGNLGTANGVKIPSVPYSMIMSLMSAPGMAPNFQASNQPQMNTGPFNMPQMGAASMMQPPANAGFGPPAGDMTGFSRSFEGNDGGIGTVVNQDGQQVGPTIPSMQGDQASAFMGGGQGQQPQMGNPRRFGPVAVSMDMSGRLSMVNSMGSAFMQQPSTGPMASSTFQNLQPGMELVNREKQMLSPSMVNPVNDLSDPMNSPTPSGLRNISPDQLLELAKMQSTERDNPEVGDARTLQRDPDTLLDTLHTRQLNRGLTGPGDPEKMGTNFDPMSNSPFAGTNPESLLDMLSKRRSNEMGNRDVMDWEKNQQEKIFNEFKNENYAYGRGGISQIGTNGMQSISSIPASGGLDPSFADMVGNQQLGVASRQAAEENPEESSFFRPEKSHFSTGPNSLSVMSHDDLRYEHSKHAIDSGESITPMNQADVYVRHKIMNPNEIAAKRSKTPSLNDDNIELKVNGKPLAETASLRSKIVDGKIQKGHGKTLTSKSPVKIELSHSDDAKKTKIINIVTTGKFNVKESRRNKISRKRKKNIIRTFYGEKSP